MWGRWIFGRRPYEDSLSIHTRSLLLSPQSGSLSTPARHLDGSSRGAPAQPFRTACLVKPVSPGADFERISLENPLLALGLQPGLFLSASRALGWEIAHPPKGFDILWLAASL